MSEEITSAAAKKALIEREASALAARRRCRCREPLSVRKYLGTWLCGLCLLPRYKG